MSERRKKQSQCCVNSGLAPFPMMQAIVKDWGQEVVIVNEPEYCAKWLHIAPGKKCSLHYHKLKKETFHVQHGIVRLEHNLDELLLAGESRTILPGVRHRFSSHKGAVILEISTHHSDEDVVRIEPSG